MSRTPLPIAEFHPKRYSTQTKHGRTVSVHGQLVWVNRWIVRDNPTMMIVEGVQLL